MSVVSQEAESTEGRGASDDLLIKGSLREPLPEAVAEVVREASGKHPEALISRRISCPESGSERGLRDTGPGAPFTWS